MDHLAVLRWKAQIIFYVYAELAFIQLCLFAAWIKTRYFKHMMYYRMYE